MARRLFRFSGSVRMKGMGSIVHGNITNVTDYGTITGAASVWPGVLASDGATQARGGVGKGATALFNQDRTWVDNPDYGLGSYGFASGNPNVGIDLGSVA